MNVALDTNAYSDLVRGDPNRLQIVETAATVYVPLIVLAELRVGFLQGTRGRRNAQALQTFLNEPDVEVLAPDESTTHVYAQIVVDLWRQGTPIPANDIWIAALVIQHNLVLCTSDKHFDQLPQIPKC
jgi:predicted nucleic acid-binding protein